jgi:magnesium chelatase family protein
LKACELGWAHRCGAAKTDLPLPREQEILAMLPVHRLTSILPAMTLAEAIKPGDASIASLGALVTGRRWSRPAHVAPHHTIPDVGLIGGGPVPMPGDMSLAHQGVLFLDELPEFRRHVLKVLRQPLEDGVTYIQSRGRAESQCCCGLS